MRWWVLVTAALLLPAAGNAQEAAIADDPGAEAAAEDLLSDDELDELVAPVALYPDSLLAQLFVAATFPLDVMKADRFLDDNADASDSERADLADAEDWDQSVKVLAGGFPDVLARMADDIDWTEDLGDAMLVQTDDLLDAVQRMRARAEAVGNLNSNAAQTVEVQGDNISIAPADPQVVYVPSYDPGTAYTTPVTSPAVVYDDPGVSFGNVLTTGAIAFGSAMLVDEIFDDDDDWDDDYWYGPRSIDWDDDAIYPGRVNVEGDVNIDVDRERNVDRDRNVKIGDRDGDQKKREDQWKADRKKRDDAHDRIASKKDQRDRDGGRGDGGQGGDRRPGQGGGAADGGAGDRLPDRGDGDANRPGGGGAGTADRLPDRGGAATRPASRDDARTKAEARMKARGDGGGGPKVAAARDRPAGAATPKRREPQKTSALKPSGSGSHGVAKQTNRAASSLKRDTSPAAVKARAPSVSKPKAIAKPRPAAKPKVAPRKPAAHATAFKKPNVSPKRSSASKSRGSRSAGKMKRR